MGDRSKFIRLVERAVPGVLVLTLPARAESPPTFALSVVRLEGTGSCPDRSSFERGVATRLGRVPFGDPAQRTLETVLSRQRDAWRAEILLRDADGIEVGRRGIDTRGPDCSPLAEATTLALALTIDPDAALVTPPGAPPPAPAAPLCAPAEAAPCPDPACPPAAPCPRCVCPRCVCPRPERPPDVAISARAVAAVGLIPGAAPGFALGAEAGSASLRGTVSVLALPETLADDRRFAFGLTTAAAGACGALHPHARWELALCGEVQLGVIHAVVREVAPVDPGDQLWLAAALGPRLRAQVVSPWVLELGISAVTPLLDRRFDVAGLDESVFRPATVGGVGFVGVGIHTP